MRDPIIRPAHLTDVAYLYDICLDTAEAGEGARGKLLDPYMIGHFYAAPYLLFDQDVCFVVEYENKPAGYIVGTSDTEAYCTWLGESWLPGVRRKYPANSAISEIESSLYEIIHETPVAPDYCADYPGHLHINLMPVLHKRGLGGALMSHFEQAIGSKGAKGFHLGVSKNNANAVGFYRHVGFVDLAEDEDTHYLGKSLS